MSTCILCKNEPAIPGKFSYFGPKCRARLEAMKAARCNKTKPKKPRGFTGPRCRTTNSYKGRRSKTHR